MGKGGEYAFKSKIKGKQQLDGGLSPEDSGSE